MANLAQERPGNRLEREVLEWADAVYHEAEQELSNSREAKQVERIIDFLEGKQWSGKGRGRSRPVANKVVRQFIEMSSLLTDIQPEVRVHFNGDMENFSQVQQLINVLLTDWTKLSDFEQELLQVVMYGLILNGPCKIQWNSELRGGLGDVEFQPMSPLNFMQIGSSGRIQDAEVVISRKVVTKPWLVRKFGEVAQACVADAEQDVAATPNRPTGISSKRWMGMNPIMRNIHAKLAGATTAGPNTRFPKSIYKEIWFKDDSIWEGSESIVIGDPRASWSYLVEPGMPKYPRGRLLVVAGGRVLEDAPNPYWHGRYPFAIYRPLRVPWNFLGLSILEPQVAIQAILNRIDGGILDNIIATVDPQFIAPMAAFSEQDQNSIDPNAPGTKIFYRNNTPRAPEWRKPPELGSYVGPAIDRYEKELAMSSGSAAINQAMQKKQVPGGDSLDMIMNARAVNIRLFGRALHSFMEDAGYLIVATKIQFETMDKRVAQYGWKGITDSDLEPYYRHLCPSGTDPEDFVRHLGFTIRRGSLLAIERNDELQIMMQLRKGGEIDHTTFLEFLNAKFDANLNIELIQQRLQKEAIEKAQVAMAMGAAAHKAKESGKHH